jgi:hypothetical protein
MGERGIKEMKCPYSINIEQVVKYTFDRDENGNTTTEVQNLLEHRKYVDCLQEECAVWIDGKCNYNQGHNGD